VISDDAAVYVYGVVRANGAGSYPAPVRAVAGGELAAVVRDVPASWRAASRADLEAHDRVLNELAARTVVPMRFGTVMDGDDAVREQLLGRHASELSALLARVEGRVQMSVRAFYLDEALLRAVLERRPELKQRSDALEALPVAATQNERIALGQEVAAAVEEQRALDQQAVVAPLARVAEDVHVERGHSERHAFTVQLLVEASRRDALDAAVQRLTAEHGSRLALRYVGPLPPYSFCDLALEPWA
jgi:hypothetical protein